ncbi:MAG TPA: class I SAM-dependent methyltransferase [Ilumatobacteraceae bacterium]|nr:class I SAM-dependent methyltransferase [Ilumatobacteraceae bacterium]
MPDAEAADPELIKLYAFQVFSKLEGAVTAGMIHLGDRLGLYRVLADADRPLTSAQLADEAELDERWVREWAYNQAAARIVVADADADPVTFTLSAEGAAVLATPSHPAFGMGMFHRLPQTMRTLEEMPESFRTGVGHDYDSHGPEGAVGIERSFEPWNRAFLLPVVLPALDGVVDKLTAGATAADVGCGAGGAVLLMAGAYPNSQFHGYDISRYALGRAEQKRTEANATNAHFHDPRQQPLPSNHTVDLITTFDCIHDMTDPQGMMHAIRQAVAHDGSWLLVDIKARDTFAQNVEKNPMAALMYGISVLSCMSSALSEPGGAGLGTLGLSVTKAEAMAREAGFTRFRKLDVDHAVNAFYEIRP